jgi:hypothetical protein
MSLFWTLDSRRQLFTVTCEGKVDHADVNAMIDALVGANGLRYRKLFDGTRGSTEMNEQEILSVGARMRDLHALQGDHGALAVILPDDKYDQISRVLGILAAAKRPMRVFRDIEKARKWLDSPPIRGGLPLLEAVEASA